MRKKGNFHRQFSRNILASSLMVLLFAFCCGCVGKDPNYTVQAGIEMSDKGGQAYAVVTDHLGQAVSDAVLTINGIPMTFQSDAGEAPGLNENEESFNSSSIGYYSLDLPDLKSGDTVTFIARDGSGSILYRPMTAIVPGPIQLLYPVEGQTITAEEEVPLSWAGGADAKMISVAYAALDMGTSFWKDLQVDGSETFTIPSGRTVSGAGVVGVAAVSGDIGVMDSFDADFKSNESFFLVTWPSGVSVDFTAPGYLAADSFQMANEEVCPQFNESPNRGVEANAACFGQFAALGIGAIIWEVRRVAEFKACPDINKACDYPYANNLAYCVGYGAIYGFLHWRTGCLQCCMCGHAYNWCVGFGKPCH